MSNQFKTQKAKIHPRHWSSEDHLAGRDFARTGVLDRMRAAGRAASLTDQNVGASTKAKRAPRALHRH